MGKRNSSSKILIEKFLRERPNQHFTAGEIWAHVKEQLPSINLSTVHRNLRALADENKVSVSDIGLGSPVFETTSHPHHHLICQTCGAALELSPAEVAKFLESVKEKFGFAAITTNHLIIYGVCAGCGQKGD